MRTRSKSYRPVGKGNKVEKIRKNQSSVSQNRNNVRITRAEFHREAIDSESKLKVHKASNKRQGPDPDISSVKTPARTQKWLNERPLSDRMTRSTRVDACRHAVFHTVELMEQILLQFPISDIFLCQAVCKDFRNVISQSPLLRTFLMLQSDKCPRQTWKYSNSPPAWHSGEARNDASWNLLKPGEEALPKQNGTPSTFTPARLNPLLRLRLFDFDMSDQFRRNSALRFHSSAGDEVKFNFKSRPTHSPIPHWEKMLVCDPPATEAHVRLRFSLQKEFPRAGSWEVGAVSFERQVRNEEGLRLEDLVRKPLLTAGEESDVFKGVRWNINGKYYVKMQAPMQVIERLERAHKVKAVLDLSSYQTLVRLHGVVVPTEEEWRTVR